MNIYTQNKIKWAITIFTIYIYIDGMNKLIK
jgi:hypothetical protein